LCKNPFSLGKMFCLVTDADSLPKKLKERYGGPSTGSGQRLADPGRPGQAG